MSLNGVYRSGHVPKRLERSEPPEQNSGDSSRIAMSTSVAKVYSHFKVSNVNKVAIFYGIVLIPLVCCSFRCTLSLKDHGDTTVILKTCDEEK